MSKSDPIVKLIDAPFNLDGIRLAVCDPKDVVHHCWCHYTEFVLWTSQFT